MDDSTRAPEEPRPKRLRVIGYAAVVLLATTSAYGLEQLEDDGETCSTPTVESIVPIDDKCPCDPDQVEGNLIMLDDNGAWSWFQDERAIYDPVGRALVFSSVANFDGHAGEERDADVEATTFALETGRRTRVALANVPTNGVGDDHNAAALWQRPDGRYLAMYTGHLFRSSLGLESFYRITTEPYDGSEWGPEQFFTWPSLDGDDVTYSNLLYLSGEERLYNIARAGDRTPHVMISDDWGTSWSYAGRLAQTSEDGRVGQYSNGYFKFDSNGVDRFDFIATEHHPRNFNTSIYHGYVSGDQSFDGCGSLLDDDIFDDTAPEPAWFAPVWVTSEPTKTSLHHGWTVDLERGDDGGLHALFTSRRGTSIADALFGDCDHRLFYGSFDGSRWHAIEIAKMGPPLHQGEQDYTGLGAIHPNDPSKIYISAPFDPRDGSATVEHEIYRGVTHDGGASWMWTAITSNSTVDNLRPIIASWDADHTAVLWLRGRYPSQRRYDLSVVGIIDQPRCESTSIITYVDASTSNTMLADGSGLDPTVGTGRGASDDRWHERQGFGNADSVLTSNERTDEDAPLLRTEVTGLAAGTYDVFVFHWANPAEDWRIQAGFSAAEMLVFRQKASQLAMASHFEAGNEITLTGGTTKLYRSYVGRVNVTDGAIRVLVDDVGSGELQRTWYDGVGYARVSSSTECH